MSSGEKLGGGVVKSEVVGEEERKTFEDRGEKTLSAAEREKRIKELQEERERLLSRNKEIEEELKRLEQEENISKQQEQAARDEIQSHVANPDEYWENVKRYNHDELEKLNNADPQANPADPNQAALDKARAYNEAHAGEMYENWQEDQDLPKNETEEQWAAFYQNRGEEFGTNKANEVQPAVAQANQASAQATEVSVAEEPGATTAEANTAETEPDDELTDEEAEVVAAAEDLPDTPEMPEVVKRLKEKGKNSKGLKKFLIGAATAAVIALVLAGIIKPTGDAKAKAPVNNPKQIEQTMETGTVDESEEEQNTGIDYESEKGIIDGYNKKGMFLSPNKGGKYDFAAGSEVAEVCDNDDHEMMKYPSRVQVECLADYIALMPENMQPEGFKGLSILEAEEKLQSLSDEEYDALFKGYGKQVEAAKTKKVELNGRYRNAYMRVIDSSKPVTHDNIELVQCVTEEHGTKATMYYWEDKEGNVIGYIIIKDDCRQGVSEESETDIYKGIEEIPQSILEGEGEGDNDPMKGDITPGLHPRQWGKSGDPHSGENRLPSDLVDPASEVSESENEDTNKGNQGYVDDNKATPGSASYEYVGPSGTRFNITPVDADTKGGRLSGGEQQGGTQMNGTNTVAPTGDQSRDIAGDRAQDNVNLAGGNNNSNAAEEAAVEGGNF